MNPFGPYEPPSTPTRELRRLLHSDAVATTYERRASETDVLETHRLDAVRQGYQEGYAEGLARAAQEAARISAEESQRAAVALSALTKAAVTMQEEDLRLRAQMQQAAPKLAFALLEELLDREVELAANPGFEAITRVLALDDGILPATVWMNPRDIASLGVVADIDLGREIRVVPDSNVEPGGVMVEIGKTTLDGQLGSALERVRQVLLGTGGSNS